MKDCFVNSLKELLQHDSNVMLLTGDLGYGMFDDFSELFPKQYLNAGVAEQNMMGVAAGLAFEGRTIFTYSIANFATLRCLEQVRNDACYHDLNINIVAFGGGFTYGAHGMSHHATEDIAIMRALPNVTVMAPATVEQAAWAVKALAKTPGVGYLRLEKLAERLVLPASHYEVGKAILYGSTKAEITIISNGGIVGEAYKALQKLQEAGVDAALLNVATIKPIDKEAIVLAATTSRAILTVEEHSVIGGLGSAVAEVCMLNRAYPKNFRMLGIDDEFTSIIGDQKFLREHYGIDNASIFRNAMDMLN